VAVSESSARRYALDPDVRLMLEVRDGSATSSAAAFEELVVRYQVRLVRLLHNLVGNRESAEELAQEVFLRVYRSRQQYVPGAKFGTWLFTIASNVACNALRDRNRRPEVNMTGSESGPLGVRPMDRLARDASGAMPERLLDKAELREVVRMAMEDLQPRQRTAVLLNKFEGMSYADIARVMDVSTQAVKSLLSRARQHLRQILGPYLENGAFPHADKELSDSTIGSGGFSTASTD
jgi:RNA polymerase sigma-70 factor (ECF subfamily)